MKDLPLVSLCIPTYNAAVFLEPCLQSAIGQTYPNLEILVCDDGSTDDTISIVREFQQRHPAVRLVQNSVNAGMVGNWNQCITMAKGAWVKFLFQDDLIAPSCVEEMLAACVEHKVMVALCRRDFLIQDNAAERFKKGFAEGGFAKAEQVLPAGYVSPAVLAGAVKQHLVHNFLGEPTCYLFHRSLVEKAGAFNPHLKQLVDYEFILRLGLQEGLAFLPQTLAWFRLHGGSESSANTEEDEQTLRAIAAGTGDSILLLHTFLHHPAFVVVKEAIGAKHLDNYAKHLYYSNCKHRGKKRMNEALSEIRAAYPEIGGMTYSFFKYAYYRRLAKSWLRKSKEESKSKDGSL